MVLLDVFVVAADDYMSEALKSGDVVVMNRDWKLYQVRYNVPWRCVRLFLRYASRVLCILGYIVQPLGALECWATKYFSGTRFDHAGVIVLLQGEPYVLEQTFTSIKVSV